MALLAAPQGLALNAGYERAMRPDFSACAFALAIAACALTAARLQRARQGAPDATWFSQTGDGPPQLTLSAWLLQRVAMSLNWFLLGRWLARYGTRGLMRYDISPCGLRLVALQPNRCGGLAFIGQDPKTCMRFVFAACTVVSSTVLRLIVHGGASVMPIILAAPAPMVCVAAMQAPIGEIMKVAKGFLLPWRPRLAVEGREGPCRAARRPSTTRAAR